MTLSPKQERFCQEYLIDLNATQAAIRAGYAPRSAAARGSRLLCSPDIRAAIEAAMQERSRTVERTAQDVLRDLQSLTQEAWQGGDLKTAMKGLELEGRHLAMWTDRQKQEIGGTLEIRWEE